MQKNKEKIFKKLCNRTMTNKAQQLVQINIKEKVMNISPSLTK